MPTYRTFDAVTGPRVALRPRSWPGSKAAPRTPSTANEADPSAGTLRKFSSMYPVTLTGRTVVLREFRPDNAPDAFRVVGDDAVTRSLSFGSRSMAETIVMINGAAERAPAQRLNWSVAR